MLAPHDYDRYRVLDAVVSRPDFSVVWAEVDGQRVQLVTAPPAPANARLTVLRRLAEREALAVDAAAPYLAGGVDERRSWMAIAAIDGPCLQELVDWIGMRRELGSAEIAARVIADVATSLREVVKRAPSLPASGVGDVRVGGDGRIVLGQLGEVLVGPRMDERELVVELGGWLTRLGGDGSDLVEPLAERAMNGSIRHLVQLVDELERHLDELGGTPRSRVGAWARHLVAENPPIAPPTLIDEYPGDAPAAPVAPMPVKPSRPTRPAGAGTGPAASAQAQEPFESAGTPMAGLMLGGRYRIVGRVANGMMGRIYEATRVGDYKRVAIKLMMPPQEDDLDAIVALQTRFRREAESLARLDHPNIVRVYDCGILPEAWLAMEFVEGPTLAKVLRTRKYLPVEDVITIGRKLCAALDHAHEHGVIHRDLKPANVILAGGDPAQVRLVDFGLAKDWDGSGDVTNDGTLLGTPHYMSPEQCNGDPARIESDLYALGMLMYRLLTGRMPFEGKKGVGIFLAHTRDPVPRFDSLGLTFEIPPQVEHVVRRCLEKKPEHRYRTAADLDAALASCEDPTAGPALALLSSARRRFEPSALGLPGGWRFDPASWRLDPSSWRFDPAWLDLSRWIDTSGLPKAPPLLVPIVAMMVLMVLFLGIVSSATLAFLYAIQDDRPAAVGPPPSIDPRAAAKLGSTAPRPAVAPGPAPPRGISRPQGRDQGSPPDSEDGLVASPESDPLRSSASGLRDPDRSSASGLGDPDQSSASGVRDPSGDPPPEHPVEGAEAEAGQAGADVGEASEAGAGEGGTTDAGGSPPAAEPVAPRPQPQFRNDLKDPFKR